MSRVTRNAEDKPERRALIDLSNQNGAYEGRYAGGAKKQGGAKAQEEIPRRSERLQERRASATTLANSMGKTLVLSQPLDDFDQEVSRDLRYVVEYAKPIHDHYLAVEPKHLANPAYMSIQTDITPRMRAILIDWLVEVHLKFKMQPQTLYICVNVLDRYLERTVVHRDQLQLIGCAALWIASKIEEIYSPEVQDFVHISDKAFKRQDLLNMEGQLLNALEFKLTFPTQYVFLTRWLRVSGAEKAQRLYAAYCTERTLQEYAFLKYKPSEIAAASLYLALDTIPAREGAPRWSDLLEKHTGLKAENLQGCAQEIKELVADADQRSLTAVFKKYKNEENLFVSTIPTNKGN